MRRPALAFLAAVAAVLSLPAAVLAQALHAPRLPLGSIVRLTPPTGCDGAVAGDDSLVSGNGRFQAYVCRAAGASSFFLYDNIRRKNIPMFGLPAGHAEPVYVSEKGNFVAILSEVPIPPGSDPIIGEWALYLFSRQSQLTFKVLEDDPPRYAEIFGDVLCPASETQKLGRPQVVYVDNRGRTLVRFDERTKASGPCPPGTYIELRP